MSESVGLRRTRFYDIAGETRAARLALLVIAGLTMLTVVADARDLLLLLKIRGGDLSPLQGGGDADTIGGPLAIVLGLVIYGVVVALFLRWLGGAYDNVAALGARRRLTRGWAIGGWFTPILWWSYPKQAIDDVWDAGDGPEERRQVTLWWVTFVLSLWVARILAALIDTINENPPGTIGVDFTAALNGLVAAQIVTVAGDVLAVASAILAAELVRDATRRLDRRFENEASATP